MINDYISNTDRHIPKKVLKCRKLRKKIDHFLQQTHTLIVTFGPTIQKKRTNGSQIKIKL